MISDAHMTNTNTSELRMLHSCQSCKFFFGKNKRHHLESLVKLIKYFASAHGVENERIAILQI